MNKEPTALTAKGLSFLTSTPSKHDYSINRPRRKKKWTTEALRLEALKYDTRLAFQKGSRSAYSQAQKHGVLDRVCRHMQKRPKDLTKDELKEDALKYTDLTSYYTNSRYYKEAARRGIREEICQHMTRKWSHK